MNKNDSLKQAVEKVKKDKARPTMSAILADGSLVETVHNVIEGRTEFCVSHNGEIRYERDLLVNNIRLAPYSPDNNLLRHEVVLLPSAPAEYASESELIEAIRSYLHRYVDLPNMFEQIATYYVLFSWVFDAFNELPYLRVRGDAGSGKTRFLLTMGAICYKPIFASGASTVSPIFRILDSINGTLIIDEGDFRFSDEKAELVKILNNGNGRGFPVLRSESISEREFSPRAYDVFGPKLIATRGYFQDLALESRCLTEEMGGRSLRTDVPINLPGEYKEEALALRNKLLSFRFRNRLRCTVDPTLADRGIEPRLSQVFVPLLSIIRDEQARTELQGLLRQYHQVLVEERGLRLEGRLLEVVHELMIEGQTEPGIKELADRLELQHGQDLGRKITPHWVGYMLRRKLSLKTERRHGSYVIPSSETDKVRRLFERYGISGEDSGDLEDSAPTPQADLL